MFKGGSVFVAGSAHLDVLAKITGDESTIDKPGEVSIEIGGTACNIATNLAALGLKPRLLTAMQLNSPYSQIITAHLKAHGVDVHAVNHESMPSAVFSAHIAPDGEMLSAVSSMPVEIAEFDENLVRNMMANSDCAILECNLSGKTLNQFARIASSLGIPVFATAVSEEKSLRISEIKVPLAAAFMNRKESTYLGRRVAATTSMPVLSDRLGCPLIVTKDKDGVAVIEDGMEAIIPPVPLPENVHTLGAGDALVAATVAHKVFGQLSLAEAAQNAVAFAAEVIAKPNCNAGQTHAMESALISLDHMATRDSMTGLFNRRAGEKFLGTAHENAVSLGIPYSVLIVDIDHFKKVNDTFGHDVGDEAIKKVAEVLGLSIRNGDAACRWGGEEFVCILHGADLNTGVLVAEKIRATIAGTEVPTVGNITTSIGVSTWQQASSYSEVIKAADQGLYQAKQGGRNRVIAS